MPRYAKETTVSVQKSRAEIEECLMKYGASEFHSGWKQDAAMIGFRLGDLFIRFVLPMPNKADRRFTHKKNRYGYEDKRTETQISQAHEQETRQRWRALLLVIKAKLEAVECGISSVESEFLAHIIMPNNVTVGEWIMETAMPAIKSGQMPPLMLAGPGPASVNADDAIDVEFEKTSEP